MPAGPSAKQPPELFTTITESKWSPYVLSSQSHIANVKWICISAGKESWVMRLSPWQDELCAKVDWSWVLKFEDVSWTEDAKSSKRCFVFLYVAFNVLNRFQWSISFSFYLNLVYLKWNSKVKCWHTYSYRTHTLTWTCFHHFRGHYLTKS